MKMLTAILITLIAIPFASALKIADVGNTFQFEIIEDTKKEVNATIEQINDTVVEITLFEHPDSTTKNNYKWDAALCNMGNLQYAKMAQEDNQGGFEFATYNDLQYDELVNYGMHSSWCNETGGFGYPLFSSGGKNQFPKKFRIQVNDNVESFRVKAGTGTLDIDTTAAGVNLYSITAQNLCMTSDGKLHGVFIDGSGSPGYVYSTDNGTSFSSTTTPFSRILDGLGLSCTNNDSLFIYYTSSSNGFYRQSTDGGTTWGSEITIFSGTSGNSISCDTGTDNILHCCAAQDEAYYVNTSDTASVETLSDFTDDTDECTTRVDETNAPWVLGIGTDFDRVEYWSPKMNGWGSSNRVSIWNDTGFISGENPSFDISNNGTIGICIIDPSDQDIIICESTTDDGTVFSCDDNIYVGTAYRSHAVFTEAGDFYCAYDSGSDIRITNTSDFVNYETFVFDESNDAVSLYGGMNGILHAFMDDFSRVKYRNMTVRQYYSPTGGGGECYETSPLTSDCSIDCSTNPIISADLNAGGYKVNTYNEGILTLNARISDFGEFANHACQLSCINPSGCFG